MECDYCGEEIVFDEDLFVADGGAYHKKCAAEIGYELPNNESNVEKRIGDDEVSETSDPDDFFVFGFA